MCRIIFMDVDGTLTDGKIYMGSKGEIMKAFDIKDGYAIANILPRYNITPVIITGRESEIVNERCKELGIKYVFQNIKNKREKVIEVANTFGIHCDNNGIYPNTYYIGDDIPDLLCMDIAEVKGCPVDAVDEVKEVSDFISSKKGGDGAVREFIEWIIKKECLIDRR